MCMHWAEHGVDAAAGCLLAPAHAYTVVQCKSGFEFPLSFIDGLPLHRL